jgi:hypothetical protein
MCVMLTIKRRVRKHCCCGKAVSAYYIHECVFVAYSSGRQSACAILYCHLWPVWFYHIFTALSHKRHDFWKKIFKHKMCVFISSINCLKKILILRIIQRDVIINVYRFTCNVPVILVRF